MKKKIAQWLFALFKAEMLDLSFQEQISERGDTTLKEAFRINGRVWYEYADDFHMPVNRFGYWKAALIEVDNKVDRKYLRKWVETTLALISDQKMKDQEKKEWLIYVVKELENRMKAMFNPDNMLGALSIYYLREDQLETKNDYDPIIEEDKLRELKEAKQGELGSFLLKSPLRGLFKSLNASKGTLDEMLAKMSAIQRIEVDKIEAIRSEIESATSASLTPNGE